MISELPRPLNRTEPLVFCKTLTESWFILMTLKATDRGRR